MREECNCTANRAPLQQSQHQQSALESVRRLAGGFHIERERPDERHDEQQAETTRELATGLGAVEGRERGGAMGVELDEHEPARTKADGTQQAEDLLRIC